MEYDGEHIWLRQSITQTVQGQTRTLEIGVSVRPGMTADQIEALLREADAGMQRLSRHLDGQMAGTDGHVAGAEPPTVELRPAPPRPTPRLPAGKPPSPAPPPADREEAREALSVKDFLDAARTEMNLNPKQAMSALNVRSLSGLNLREALEVLRRQALGSASGATVNGAAAEPRGGSAPVTTPPPRYFEEEDEGEFDVTLTFDEEDIDRDDSDDSDNSDDSDDREGPDELEDVPDFDAEPAPPASAKVTPIAGERARATQIIGQLRAAAAGGSPTSQQRAAYRNIILNELGDQPARALVQGLWRVDADKLGAEQLDALVSWGKRDTFGEEADLVLKALRAERGRKSPGDDVETRPPRRAVPPR